MDALILTMIQYSKADHSKVINPRPLEAADIEPLFAASMG